MSVDFVDFLCNRFCFRFVNSSRGTIYLPLLFVTLVSLLCGSLFIIVWFYQHGLSQQTDAIQLTVDAIGERTRNTIIDEFWVPQMLLSLTIAGLFDGDLEKNASKANGEYDDFWLHSIIFLIQTPYLVLDSIMMTIIQYIWHTVIMRDAHLKFQRNMS